MRNLNNAFQTEILKLKKIGIKHIWNIAEKKLFKKKREHHNKLE